jgi:hypothetical protein
MSHLKFFFSTFSIILLILLFACSKVDTKWHRYQGRQQDILGSNKDKVKIISEGWKIIGETGNRNSYEWGWELVLIVSRGEEDKIIETPGGKKLVPLFMVKEIEYILYDNDDFELVRDRIGEQFIDFGKDETFRKTSLLSKSKAIRAVKSSIRIVTY